MDGLEVSWMAQIYLQFQQVHDFGAGSLMFLAYDASLREELLQLGDALHVKVRLRPGGWAQKLGPAKKIKKEWSQLTIEYLIYLMEMGADMGDTQNVLPVRKLTDRDVEIVTNLVSLALPISENYFWLP